MTLTLPGADIRGYYTALQIPVPDWARESAPTRCFAALQQHAHEDRTPSTSIHLESGAWKCHGCGAKGSAYDAAITRGHTTRTAIELMIPHRLISPDARITTQRVAQHRNRRWILPFEATAGRLRNERLIADLTVVEIADGPHNIAWTHRDEVNAALLNFLAR